MLAGSAFRQVIGDVANTPLAEGTRETIARFRAALAAGLIAPGPS
jgi:hypothetical protein